MNTAIHVQPNGHIEHFHLADDPQRQQADIAAELDGPVTAWRLGRHLTVHAGVTGYRRSRNGVALSTWQDLAGGPGPDLRGPVVATGAPSGDGLLQPLPAASAELVEHWARLQRAAAVVASAPEVSAAQATGTRKVQCDAYAVRQDRASGRWAFVVLDGIGDDEEVRAHVGRWAPELAREAALLGDPAEAIIRVRARIIDRVRRLRGRRWHYSDPGAVAVVAVYHPGDPLLHLAWSGDARAYRLSYVAGLDPLTKDHNYAQELLDAGRTPRQWDHNSVTATLEDGVVGVARCDVDICAQLILCSDGVYHPLETHEPGLLEMAAELALDAKDSAATLVAEALAIGRRRKEACDNATALVVRFPRPGA
ncbi:PP2C family protein-serine/threonine phosphatase [Streptomyces kebangsaanensis]|uniref:PP2C family protein-serine/threonine phosphatase n=1 Tax=Streptomyces kebangsaanensis TaxID=864058 RepID=UPI00093CC69B|nr:SpoIIE family protein phosphatase [Streptomyces kebangsaanensis]